MDYTLIELPFGVRLSEGMDLDFARLSLRDARAFSGWFRAQIPHRITVLTRALHSTPGFEAWTPDLSPGSLDPLTAWLGQVVSSRPRRPDELEELYDDSPPWIRKIGAIADSDLSEATYSICFDLGMYVASTFIHNVAGLSWHVVQQPVTSVDLHQTVLVGFGRMEFNPVRMMRVQARKSIRKSPSNPADIREVYDIWLHYIPAAPRPVR